MNGKSKCKILKDIRRQIAQDNDIEYVTSECKYQGDCSGTCPKCESEVRYLEQELEKRLKAGKAIAVAGIAAALMVGSTGCALDNLVQTTTAGSIVPDSLPTETTTLPQDDTLTPPGAIGGEPFIPDPSDPELQGTPVEPDPTEDVLMGAMPAPTEDVFMGDIAIWP